MNHVTPSSCLGLLFAFAFGAGCSSSSGGASGSAADSGPPPTWTQVYNDIISPTCAMPCHNPTGVGGQMGKLDMSTKDTAYTNLVNVAAAGVACAGKGTRVIPGMPDMSIMYLKASNDDPTPCGGKMPLGSNGLPADKADELKAWIVAGAKND
jgi:hypothetical protein